MARIKGNKLTQGVTGMIGKQIVYKNRLGTEYAAAAPEVNKYREPTPGQKKMQGKMARATAYSQKAIKDPELKKAYEAVATGGQTAANMANSDAWHAPVVNDIIANGYKGNAGDVIFVQATDDFRVASVKISIFDRAGALIEEGQALLHGLMWMYVGQHNHDNASRIVATAYDLPENEGVLEVMI